MFKKRVTALIFILCLLFTSGNNGSMFVNMAKAETPSGSYSITSINQFSSTFRITLQGISNATHFNVYKKSNNTVVNSVPVSIASAINSMPAVYADIADLEVRVYSDSAGTNTIAEFTLNSSNQLVLKGSTVAVTGVSLNKSSTNITVGQTEQLAATVAPADATDQSVTWSSSNTNSATVSDTGLVTAVNEGTAVIKAASNANASKYAECNVAATVPQNQSPSGSYSITPINQFSSAFRITLQGISNAAYFNVYKKSSDTVVNSVPVSIDSALNSMPAVYADITDLEVRVYSDSAGTNTIAEFTLNSDNQLILKDQSTTEGCFIATAAFGSKFDWPVALLREFRDQYLLTNAWGTAFVKFYYQHSPPIAAIIATSQPLKILVRVLLAPVIAIVYIMYHPILMVTVLLIGFLIYRYRLRRRYVQA
jgi:hypothetical protein